MVIARATLKGQIVIPVALRKKYHIHKGSRMAIIDREGEIVLKPIQKDIVSYAQGIFKEGPSALKALIRDRRWEAKR